MKKPRLATARRPVLIVVAAYALLAVPAYQITSSARPNGSLNDAFADLCADGHYLSIGLILPWLVWCLDETHRDGRDLFLFRQGSSRRIISYAARRSVLQLFVAASLLSVEAAVIRGLTSSVSASAGVSVESSFFGTTVLQSTAQVLIIAVGLTPFRVALLIARLAGRSMIFPIATLAAMWLWSIASASAVVPDVLSVTSSISLLALVSGESGRALFVLLALTTTAALLASVVPLYSLVRVQAMLFACFIYIVECARMSTDVAEMTFAGIFAGHDGGLAAGVFWIVAVLGFAFLGDKTLLHGNGAFRVLQEFRAGAVWAAVLRDLVAGVPAVVLYVAGLVVAYGVMRTVYAANLQWIGMDWVEIGIGVTLLFFQIVFFRVILLVALRFAPSVVAVVGGAIFCAAVTGWPFTRAFVQDATGAIFVGGIDQAWASVARLVCGATAVLSVFGVMEVVRTERRYRVRRRRWA